MSRSVPASRVRDRKILPSANGDRQRGLKVVREF
jgi:hypothetical protein